MILNENYPNQYTLRIIFYSLFHFQLFLLLPKESLILYNYLQINSKQFQEENNLSFELLTTKTTLNIVITNRMKLYTNIIMEISLKNLSSSIEHLI